MLLAGPSRRHAVFVGEGIETTVSAVSLTGRGGIAAVSAVNLPKLRLPPTVRLIYLLVDPDPAGDGGNTAWSKGVRSRLYLTKPQSDNDSGQDGNRRILSRKKSELRRRHRRG